MNTYILFSFVATQSMGGEISFHLPLQFISEFNNDRLLKLVYICQSYRKNKSGTI